jgi:DNA-binding CsgD family transcriptional regulator
MAPIAVVHGDAGIGKTRTVAEFARWARADARVLWGTVYEGAVGQPYAPWVEALTSGRTVTRAPTDVDPRLVGSSAPRLLGRHVFDIASDGANAPVVATPDPVPPGLAQVVGLDEPVDAAVGSEGARLHLFEAVVRHLSELDDARVLVLDNLQWAGPDTLELLRYIARTGLRHLLLVLVYRGGALTIGHPLTSALADLRRTRPMEEIALGRLNADEASALLTEVAQRPLDPELVEAVIREGAGNPFFISEIGEELRRHGALVGFGTANWRPPASIRQAVGLRLAGLSAEASNMLELASAFTSGFEFEDLAAVSEAAEDALLDSLDEALGADVLRSIDTGRYDFAQALVRQTLYDGFSPSRRARMHRRIASVIEQRHAGRLAEVAAELALQYHESRMLPGAEAGLPHALTAARQCRAANAPERAVEFLEWAFDLAPGQEPATRAEVAGELAVALAEASLVDKAPHSLETALTMLEECDAPAGTIADVVYRTTSILQDAMADQDALEPGIERGLAAVGSRRDLAWARLKLLERPRQRIIGGSIVADRWLGLDPDAVNLARTEGNERDFARTLEQLDPWTPAELMPIAEKIRGWGDRRAQVRGLEVVAHCLCCSHGAPPGAGAIVAEFAALVDRFGGEPARSMALMYEGIVRGTDGDLPAALKTLSAAQALADLAPQTGRLRALTDLATALTRQHLDPDWPALAARMEQQARRPENVRWIRLALAAFAALALVEAGRPEEGQGLLREIVPAIGRCDPADYAQSCAVSLAAEAAKGVGNADLARDLIAPCRSLLERDVGDYYMTSNELTAARLFTTLGQRHEALRHISAARAKAIAHGQRPLRAIIDYEEWVITRDSPKRDGFVRLSNVVAEFERLGMLEWVRRTTLQQPAAAPHGLTKREVDVLRLVATGKTNREIALDLVISVYTVERHVHNAYTKIGVRNRADATAYVIRHSL